MATAAQRAQKKDLGPDWRETLAASIRGFVRKTFGLALIGLSVALAVALVTHSSTDPSLSTAAGGPPTNWLGAFGAYSSDALLFLFGPASALFLPLVALAGLRLVRGVDTGPVRRAMLVAAIGVTLIGVALGLYAGSAVSGLPAGYGGALGLAGAYGVDAAVKLIGNPSIEGPLRLSLMAILALAGLVVGWLALGIRPEEKQWAADRFRRDPAAPLPRPRRTREELSGDEEGVAAPPRSRPAVAVADPAKPIAPAAKANPKKGKGSAPGQASLALGDNYQLPSIELLTAAPEKSKGQIDRAGLERNARLLESVLEDFHVRGDIVEVRPGPVVTMYELEPASGIKASRVIQLADDIARNMSALSARVATIPGRSVIGIELPNQKRETVSLSELIGSQAFEDQNMALPLILGKNISGDPVIADLAPMPHLLVAGTTGSGKSVGLNCMILSLLYRMSPDECRLIMIDPKMLELSIYDDIPHLLAPVVTEPGKAIRALKWTVEQMEERYRMMASLGVRQLASFNQKVRDAKAKGSRLGRRVQTGYDADTGQPVYETEELEYEVLPQIVVVVDELADLMMTAGKEVEFLIQRLAQKARAAGIHLIMATQRPSVDVITGVIKANLPTRISFQVTSKIDSRTILGEQGAEQLLGKGDMLYMPGGKQIIRVHGPFVSDEEVRLVAEHWRRQGVPDYIQAVTEEPEDGGYLFDGQPVGDDDPETQLYRKAIQIVAESQKASTSYLQRQLRVGYNSAARLIERMEKDGLVGQPDHVGRREVLIDTDGHPI
ncbi:DNA translocase FtsK 4TM domain-containing protein [Sphingomonas sp. NSE70-1]|uniref:DNA translocase FtsK n=1 Tax=Sphingomonas caseinilyticus TaxID=2908205 RepID=A0ABT0RV31_9SPHN|nr:DNA translocase FtsK 4TM domain-containing protein [Sphingomonas caseinilyticus]MCL6698781.1 DNA translocase FtsK 4TM domain-containing protein [Sphingomonas caseinilyticus]